MSFKNEVLALADGGEATFKQNGLLFSLTGLKWWSVENMPKPTCKQASLIIKAIFEFLEDRSLYDAGQEIVDAISLFFPSFEDPSEIKFRGGRRKGKGQGDEQEEQPAPAPEPKQDPKPKHQHNHKQKPKTEAKQEQKPEKKEQPKPQTPKDEKPAKGQAIDDIRFLIEADITNIWMVGPAGCGKTTICKIVGEQLGIPVTVIPCGAGTSATTFLGYKYPERESTEFVGAFSQEGIIVLDEFTALEAQVAQIANAALANGELSATTGTVKRHPRCIIVATSNTFGQGADRMYVSNNQLDASTINRFAGGILEVDYSHEYESQYDHEVCQFVWHMRDVISRNNLRKIASTREIIAACKLKDAGMKNWKERLIVTWTKDEKALL